MTQVSLILKQATAIISKPFGVRFAVIQALLVSVMILGLASLLTDTAVQAAPKRTVALTKTMQTANFALPEAAIPYVRIHFSTYEFPNRGFVAGPPDAERSTQFYKFLNNSLQNNGHMALVNNFEKSDYRVELECTGIIHCSELQLNIYDTFRNYLASIKMPRPAIGVSDRSLQKHADVIAQELQKRLMAFNSGGFGAYNTSKRNKFE
jgi:hypothetical protein